MNNLNDYNGVFEKKFNLKIEKFTGDNKTIVHKAYDNYHNLNHNFNNYHTV